MDDTRRMTLQGRKILVTGATGFIGGRLIEKLYLEHGAVIRVLVRDISRAARIARFPVEFVHGDLMDGNAVRRAVEGAEVVFHCVHGNRRGTAPAVNVDGAEMVAQEVLRSGISRLVHVSTMAVYGHPADGEVTETTPHEGTGDIYTQTKREGERRVMALHHRKDLPAVVIQPTCVYGPWGLAFTIDPLRELRTRSVPLVDGGRGLFPGVYIDDLVDALVLAATERAAVGETFLISGAEPVSFRRYYAAFEAMLGRTSTICMTADEIREYARTETARQQSRDRVRGQLSAEGIACSKAEYATPFRIPSEHVLSFYSSRARYSIAKAQRMLGYRPAFDFDRGMQITKEWAKWTELIPPAGAS